MINKGSQLYEGKTKIVYDVDDDNVILRYKDDASAFNGVKKAQIKNKGILNNKISEIFFTILKKHNVKNHFVKRLNDREQLCRKVKVIPLEFIVRNVIAGAMAKRLLIPEGTIPPNTIFEICYKDDSLDDPLINDHHAVALGIVTYDELKEMYSLTNKINEVLKKVLIDQDIILVDFKIEFGRTKDGNIILADEISPDTCRLWDRLTHDRLDKDRFRRDLGNIEEAYIEILKRIEKSE